MLNAVQFPASIAYLHTSLSNMKGDDFSHEIWRIFAKIIFLIILISDTYFWKDLLLNFAR